MACVYRLVGDVDRFQYVQMFEEIMSEIYPLDGTEYGRAWVPSEAWLGNEEGLIPDIWPMVGCATVALGSADVARLLKPALDGVELLGLPVGKKRLRMINVLSVVDALDPKRVERDSDDPALIRKFAFDPTRIKTSLFKIPERVTTDIFTIEGLFPREKEFKFLVESNGLKGAKFELLWKS